MQCIWETTFFLPSIPLMSDSRPRDVLMDACTPVPDDLFWNRNKENFFKNSIIHNGRSTKWIDFAQSHVESSFITEKNESFVLLLKMHRKPIHQDINKRQQIDKIIMYAKLSSRWASFFKHINTRPHSLGAERK